MVRLYAYHKPNQIESTISEQASLLEIQPDRVGHATYLDPASRAYLARERVPIEMCMTSNVLCGTVSDYGDHHASEFLQAGHPCVLAVRLHFVLFVLSICLLRHNQVSCALRHCRRVADR
jgi:adenosine deaminase